MQDHATHISRGTDGSAGWLSEYAVLLVFTCARPLIPTIALLLIQSIRRLFQHKHQVQSNQHPLYCKVISGICLCALLVLCFCGIRSTAHYYAGTFGNFPVTHWLMMGLSADGTFQLEEEQYTQSFLTKSQKVHADLGKIKERLIDYGISGLARHSLRKLAVTWGDGSARYPAHRRK